MQKPARHSDPRLTFNTYARTFDDAEQRAVTFLPDCDFVFHSSFNKNGRQGGVSERQSETVTSESTPKTAFLAIHQIPPRGVEPLEENRQALNNQALTEDENSVLATGLDKILQKFPELRAIVKAWPDLPEQVKTAVRTLIETHKAAKTPRP